jgi:hypothetical protein
LFPLAPGRTKAEAQRSSGLIRPGFMTISIIYCVSHDMFRVLLIP